MANASTRRITSRSIMKTAAFKKGYEEAKKGLPLNSDGFVGKDAWHYERGRLFAFCYNGKIKEGRRLRMDALFAFQQAYYEDSII